MTPVLVKHMDLKRVQFNERRGACCVDVLSLMQQLSAFKLGLFLCLFLLLNCERSNGGGIRGRVRVRRLD
jgi:hypothetical protein